MKYVLIFALTLIWTHASFAKQRRSEGASSRTRISTRKHEPTRSIFKQTSFLIGGSAGTFTTPGYQSQANLGLAASALIDIGRGNFVFETGLTYLELGTVRSVSGSTQLDEIRMNLNYIGVPLNAKYSFYNSDAVSFAVRLGVMPMFTVSTTGEARLKGNSIDRLDIETNKFDVAGVLGLGSRIRIGDRMHLLIETNALLGATSIDQEKRGDTRNVGVSVLSGLSFDL